MTSGQSSTTGQCAGNLFIPSFFYDEIGIAHNLYGYTYSDYLPLWYLQTLVNNYIYDSSFDYFILIPILPVDYFLNGQKY